MERNISFVFSSLYQSFSLSLSSWRCVALILRLGGVGRQGSEMVALQDSEAVDLLATIRKGRRRWRCSSEEKVLTKGSCGTVGVRENDSSGNFT
jgi:hypothetical protein